MRITMLAVAVLSLASGALAQSQEPPPSVNAIGGETVITVGPKAQAASGIRVQVLAISQHRAETVAYGSVLDVQPLLELGARYRAAQAEATAARAALRASQLEYERTRSLNALDKNASDRAVQAAQATWEADRAKASAAAGSAMAIRALASSRWGETLASQALEDRRTALSKLLLGKEVLIEMALPPDASTPSSLGIAVPGAHGRQVPAQFVSPSPRADLLTQGATFFYRAPSGDLRAGWRVEARVPLGERAAQGVVVPESAVIWHANRPWVYVQTDATHFVRRALANATATPGGWLVAEGWRGGERVAVAGAQLLFSEEFKPRQRAEGKTRVESDDD